MQTVAHSKEAEQELEIAQLKRRVAELEDKLCFARNSRDDANDEARRLRDELDSVCDTTRVIHDTLRELGVDLGANDVPWHSTTTEHRMRITEAMRRAGHEI
jgi:chromosome segregation ATPase